MGQHRGLHFYTIGQRKGHGVASPKEGMAYVVVGKRAAENQLVIGWDREDTEGLYLTECVVGTISSINESIPSLKRVEAQPRYRAKAETAKLEALDDGRVKLIFDKPQRALVAGQIMAFYDGGDCWVVVWWRGCVAAIFGRRSYLHYESFIKIGIENPSLCGIVRV